MRPLAPLAILASLLLAGCTGDPGSDGGPVARERLAFDVVSDVNGVAPNATGGLTILTGPGLAMGALRGNATLTLGLEPVVQTTVFQACVAQCVQAEVARGAVLAEGGLVSLRNLSLNAAGPDGDSAVFFHDAGRETGRFLRWSDVVGSFQMNADLQVVGNVSGTHHVGTTTPLLLDLGAGSQLVRVATAATEGAEATVFARGSAQLVNGSAAVRFPDAFAALVGEGPITAQLTLTSDGPPLYVEQKAKDGMIVRASGGADSDATFDWFVQAVRKGSEDFQP